MKRLFLTIEGKKCPFGCRYCFADFKQYQPPLSIEALASDPERLLEGIDVLYPSCDIDFFALRNPLLYLEKLADYGRIISISTKAPLNEKLVCAVAKLNEKLLRNGSFIKISVSFSTKFSIDKIEPGTANFKKRISNLEMLEHHCVPTSAIIKPVLPQIGVSEYFSLVDSTAQSTKNLVLGGLYLNSVDARLDTPQTDVDFREVNWALSKPTWPVIASSHKINQIVTHSKSVGVQCFHSDLGFVAAVKEKIGTCRYVNDLIPLE